MDVTCRVCGCAIGADNGYKNGGGKPGMRTICRECNRAEAKARRAFQEEPSTPKATKTKMRTELAPRKRDTVELLDEYTGESTTDYLINSKTPGAYYSYDYGLYLEALDKDPHLASVWKQRKSAVLSKTRTILPADDTDDAEYAAEFHHQVIQNISMGEGDTGFVGDLGEMLLAMPLGISIAELMWGWKTLYVRTAKDQRERRAEVNKYVEGKMADAGTCTFDERVQMLQRYRMLAEATVQEVKAKPFRAYMPLRLLSRHPRRFKFDADGRLMLRVPDQAHEIYLPDKKFLLFRPESRFEDPYGVAGMRVAWWMSWFKRIVMNFWVRFTETYGDPLAIAEPDANIEVTNEDKADILTKLATLQSQTGILMPRGMSLNFREPNRSGSVSTYRELIDFANAEMSKAIIGQTLTTEAGHRGARSLGEVQQDVAAAYTTQDAYALMALVNGTLLPWIHDLNIPGTPLPRMDINIEESSDKLADAQLIEAAQRMGIPVSRKGALRKLNIAMARDESDILVPLQQTMQEAAAESALKVADAQEPAETPTDKMAKNDAV